MKNRFKIIAGVQFHIINCFCLVTIVHAESTDDLDDLNFFNQKKKKKKPKKNFDNDLEEGMKVGCEAHNVTVLSLLLLGKMAAVHFQTFSSASFPSLTCHLPWRKYSTEHCVTSPLKRLNCHETAAVHYNRKGMEQIVLF